MSNIKDRMKDYIPERSFGHCRWCGEDSQRLNFLMCSSCFRIGNLVPSKALVLLNQPDLKKKYHVIGSTIKNVTPDLCHFLLDEKSRFPPERSDKEHWQTMIEESMAYISTAHILQFNQELEQIGESPIYDEAQAQKVIGIHTTLRFILRVAVLRGLIKMESSLEDEEFFKDMVEACLEDATVEGLDFGKESIQPEKEPKKHVGMQSRDIIFRNKKR